jgi:head-tail adaptor
MRVRKDSTTSTVTAADRVVVRGNTWAIKDVIQVDSKGTVLEFTLLRGVAS